MIYTVLVLYTVLCTYYRKLNKLVFKNKMKLKTLHKYLKYTFQFKIVILSRFKSLYTLRTERILRVVHLSNIGWAPMVALSCQFVLNSHDIFKRYLSTADGSQIVWRLINRFDVAGFFFFPVHINVYRNAVVKKKTILQNFIYDSSIYSM